MHAHTPNTLSFPSDREDRDPRCLMCGYRLVGLDHPQCPECGRAFAPDTPDTYARQRPFVWHHYWWPGALLALFVGLVWCAVFYANNAMGWGLFVGVPSMLGTLMGFRPHQDARTQAPKIATHGAVGIVATLLIAMLMLGGLAGLFCAIMLLGIFLPLAFGGYFLGMFLAIVLGTILKQTEFRQREYLPILLLLIAMPGLIQLAQVTFAPPLQPVTVSTTQLLAVDVQDAWDAQMFYEDVPGPRPILHSIGLPRPVEAQGKIRKVGDQHISTYTKDARIVKQATAFVPCETIAFNLIEQQNFEDSALRFMHGRFDFQPIDANQTRVTLTSTYQPLMRPRVLWKPIERTLSRTLHGHILKGMAEKAQTNTTTAANTYAKGGTP
ncbi:MAG: hypothetical protein AB8C95_09025 [Phycisphaeraceae bacterium]